MQFVRKLALVPLVFLFILSCRKPTSANWDVDAVLPVVTSSLNIKNFTTNTSLKADDTGLLHIVLNREVASLKLDSLFSLPDTSFKQDFIVSGVFQTTLTPGQQFTLLPSNEINFNIGNGAELKKVQVRRGILTVKFSNTVDGPLDLIYELNSATKNGEVFTINETIPTGEKSLVKSYDLSGYSLNLRGVSGKKYNSVYQTYTLGLNPSSNTVVIAQGQVKGAKIEVSYSEIIPEYIEGYFGQQVIVLPKDSVKLSIGNNFSASNFMLNDASMSFNILNEFGAEFSANIYNVKATNSFENKNVVLKADQLTSVNIDRASKSDIKVFPSIKNFLFNTANSNITSFLSTFFNRLTYAGSISLNPLGNISSHNDFAFYNTGVKILADIDIPLRYTADNFKLKTKANVNFSNLSQLDNVNSGAFVLNASNGFPFDAKLQAYMLNSNGSIIDSLFLPGFDVFAKGNINNQNEVISRKESTIRVAVSAEKIKNLKICKSIQIVSYFIMPPNPPEIKLKESYGIDLSIVAEINYNAGIKR